MLITGVQSVISAFHENLSPFNQRGREETGDRTDNDFLHEGGVHSQYLEHNGCHVRGINSPKTPLFCLHDPEPQQQICDGMGHNARGKAFCPIRHAVI
jgi:hypothetical protein